MGDGGGVEALYRKLGHSTAGGSAAEMLSSSKRCAETICSVIATETAVGHFL